MRNCLLAMGSLILCATLSAAQDKISSQWKCEAKLADQHSIAVGDREGHSYNIAQGKCTAEKGTIAGIKEQEGTFTEFEEVNNGPAQDHGEFVETLASGDKIFLHYRGSATLKDGNMETANNKWTLAGGTGKFQQAKGEGSCKGKGNPDGSSTFTCEGTYSTGK